MSNYIAIADRDDKPIGKSTLKVALEKGLIRRIVKIFIINREGKILITKRSERMLSSPGKWDMSSAGHVDPGETYKHAAYRELGEELGIKGILLTRLGKFYNERKSENVDSRSFSTVFLGYYNSIPILDSYEFTDFKWLSVDELKNFLQENEFTSSFGKAFGLLQRAIQ